MVPERICMESQRITMEIVAESVLSFQTTTASSTPHHTPHRTRYQNQPKVLGEAPEMMSGSRIRMVRANNKKGGELNDTREEQRQSNERMVEEYPFLVGRSSGNARGHHSKRKPALWPQALPPRAQSHLAHASKKESTGGITSNERTCVLARKCKLERLT